MLGTRVRKALPRWGCPVALESMVFHSRANLRGAHRCPDRRTRIDIARPCCTPCRGARGPHVRTAQRPSWQNPDWHSASLSHHARLGLRCVPGWSQIPALQNPDVHQASASHSSPLGTSRLTKQGTGILSETRNYGIFPVGSRNWNCVAVAVAVAERHYHTPRRASACAGAQRCRVARLPVLSLGTRLCCDVAERSVVLGS
jgi:hypothetical protein